VKSSTSRCGISIGARVLRAGSLEAGALAPADGEQPVSHRGAYGREWDTQHQRGEEKAPGMFVGNVPGDRANCLCQYSGRTGKAAGAAMAGLQGCQKFLLFRALGASVKARPSSARVWESLPPKGILRHNAARESASPFEIEGMWPLSVSMAGNHSSNTPKSACVRLPVSPENT
jgi:hypothetical protein